MNLQILAECSEEDVKTYQEFQREVEVLTKMQQVSVSQSRCDILLRYILDFIINPIRRYKFKFWMKCFFKIVPWLFPLVVPKESGFSFLFFLVLFSNRRI